MFLSNLAPVMVTSFSLVAVVFIKTDIDDAVMMLVVVGIVSVVAIAIVVPVSIAMVITTIVIVSP